MNHVLPKFIDQQAIIFAKNINYSCSLPCSIISNAVEASGLLNYYYTLQVGKFVGIFLVLLM